MNELNVKDEKQELYINFFKRILTDTVKDESLRNRFFEDQKSVRDFEMIKALGDPVESKSLNGEFWPARAHTMIGLKRLDNLQYCTEDVIKNNIEGDFIETGVWRGGTCIFLRMMLKVKNISNKNVWVADSFEGIPKPDAKKYPLDGADTLHTKDELKVSLDQTKDNFKKYEMLDDQVKFLKGNFSTTTKNPPFNKLSILRLDGDLYGSTWEVLENLYGKLSKGGYLIIDDYYLPTCRAAVNDFRKKHDIKEPITPIDWTGIYWKKGENNKTTFTSLAREVAFDVLLKKFNERIDLQQVLPEVQEGRYQSLINWACGVVRRDFEDKDYPTLSLFKDWYIYYEAPVEDPLNFVNEIIQSTKSQGKITFNNTIKNDISDHLPTLFFLTVEFNLKKTLELGVRDGFSTLALTEAASQINGHVWSVDLDDCNIAKQKIKAQNLDSYWTFIQGESISVAENWNQEVDHIFIDTAHLYKQTLGELHVYEKFLSPNGFLTFYDTISFPGVLKAIRDFLKNSKHKYCFYNFQNNNGFAVLRKKI